MNTWSWKYTAPNSMTLFHIQQTTYIHSYFTAFDNVEPEHILAQVNFVLHNYVQCSLFMSHDRTEHSNWYWWLVVQWNQLLTWHTWVNNKCLQMNEIDSYSRWNSASTRRTAQSCYRSLSDKKWWSKRQLLGSGIFNLAPGLSLLIVRIKFLILSYESMESSKWDSELKKLGWILIICRNESTA